MLCFAPSKSFIFYPEKNNSIVEILTLNMLKEEHRVEILVEHVVFR